MADLRDLLDASEDAAVARFRRESAAVLRRITRELKTLTAKYGNELDGDARREVLARLQRDWDAILRRAGWDDLADKLEADLGRLVPKIKAAVAQETDVSRASLGVHDRRIRAQLNGLVDDVIAVQAEDVRRALRKAVIVGGEAAVDRSDLIAAVAGKVGAGTARAVALVDTTIFGVDRAVTLDGALEGGFELFLYDGPRDQLTRPFCAERLGYIFKREQMDETDNDTGPNPPSIYCGGYNCRHRWVPQTSTMARGMRRWRS